MKFRLRHEGCEYYDIKKASPFCVAEWACSTSDILEFNLLKFQREKVQFHWKLHSSEKLYRFWTKNISIKILELSPNMVGKLIPGVNAVLLQVYQKWSTIFDTDKLFYVGNGLAYQTVVI